MSSIPLNNAPFPLHTSSINSKKSTIYGTAREEGPLDASRDARRIVRLAQCPVCSYILHEPVTLPCGSSLCKKCIPELHLRKNISYPATPNRLQGFTCPFASCGGEHVVGDCSVNVVLNKVTSLVKHRIQHFKKMPEFSERPLQVEGDEWAVEGLSALRDQKDWTQIHPGRRLVSTYIMAENGELPYDAEIPYHPSNVSLPAKAEALDTVVLEQLKDATRSELECQVCYTLFLDPFTTSCGHTFCRKCIRRVRDHSSLCPVCRRAVDMPSAVSTKQYPANILINNLLTGLYPDALAARVALDLEPDMHIDTKLDTSLFVCTLSFPTQPTFLHIFEPRYRLMIRRAIESGDRKFGMVLANPSRTPQGALGPIPFCQYGTLLEIVNMQLMQDGRSIIETIGVARFRVLQEGELDGYRVGQIERIEDMSLDEEEDLEARETTSVPSFRSFSAQDKFDAPRPAFSKRESRQRIQPGDYDSIPTRELFEIGVGFVKNMREQSAAWLHHSVIQAYGQCPTDPALFPWWFASVLPLSDSEKYKLLSTTSVRERLKICAVWIAEIEGQRLTSSSSCTVL